jgi:hypothetical protein
MNIRPARVAALGAGAGALVAVVLLAVSMLRSSPGGPGENFEWLLAYVSLLGFPTSLAPSLLVQTDSPLLVYGATLLALPANWALLTYIAARAFTTIKDKK